MLAIPRYMLIQNVMVRPDEIECRDGYDQRTAGFEKRDAAPKRIGWIGQMLQNIQKQNKRILFVGAKGIVKWTDINFLKVWIRGVNNFAGCLYALDVAEFHQAIE